MTWSLYSSPIVEQGKSWQRTRIDIPGFPIVLLSGPYHGALKTNLFTPLLAVTRDVDIIRRRTPLLCCC